MLLYVDFWMIWLFVELVFAVPLTAIHARNIDITELKSHYDYIIVGGGTAGLTLADRLSESPDYDVLVLEDGDFFNASDPFGGNGARCLSDIKSAPQHELGNRTISVGVGNCVGGSSAVNGMAVMRGTKQEYDIWAELGEEDSTWNWEGLLLYFRKAIHFIPPNPAFAADFNITYDVEAAWGQDSNTHVYASYPGGVSSNLKTYYNALKTMPGVEFPRDGHAGSHGVFWYPVSVDPKTKKRSYSRTGHWDDIHRPNYHLLTNAKVNKIHFEDFSASGVRFVHKSSNKTTNVWANEEVILSAGTIHTPQILQLSGIGPSRQLKEAGIQPFVDLPGVGANFQDHPIGPSVLFDWGIRPPVPPTNSSGNQTRSEGQGQGLVGFLHLPAVAPEKHASLSDAYRSQDISEFFPHNTHPQVIAGYEAQQELFARAMLSTNVSFLDYIVAPAPVMSPINLHIMSRGSVFVDKRDLQAEPVVDYRALSNPMDVDLMIAYIEFARRLFRSDYLAQYEPREIQPGAQLTSRDDLAAYIKRFYNPQGWHPIGTAAKMRRELGGVVDDELKVYGLERLRIVDGSIMPTLIGGTTQFTVYTIAEKAAAMIKETWEEDRTR